MYSASIGHRFILVFTNGVTNYLVTIPFYRATSNEAGEVLTYYVFHKYDSSSYSIFDEDQAFLPHAMQYITKNSY